MAPIQSSLTADTLRALFPGLRRESVDAELYRAHLRAAASEFGIDKTPQRLAMWLANIGHETAGLTVLEENLHFTAQQVLQLWPRRFVDLAEATRVVARGVEAIAERAYGGRMGNRAEGAGDGYKYRGRGPVMLTGHENYAFTGERLHIPLLVEPDRAKAPEDMFRIAADFVARNKLNVHADNGDFETYCRVLNGGEIGLRGPGGRIEWHERVRRVLAQVAAA